jgi:hypothetical protein
LPVIAQRLRPRVLGWRGLPSPVREFEVAPDKPVVNFDTGTEAQKFLGVVLERDEDPGIEVLEDSTLNAPVPLRFCRSRPLHDLEHGYRSSGEDDDTGPRTEEGRSPRHRP